MYEASKENQNMLRKNKIILSKILLIPLLKVIDSPIINVRRGIKKAPIPKPL
jgi:hypothetical protein